VSASACISVAGHEGEDRADGDDEEQALHAATGGRLGRLVFHIALFPFLVWASLIWVLH
jgi:hypothetical protein